MVRAYRDHHEDQLRSKCSICCCPAQTPLEGEDGENKEGDEEDKEEDENDGSRCQHSPSSSPQRVRKA